MTIKKIKYRSDIFTEYRQNSNPVLGSKKQVYPMNNQKKITIWVADTPLFDRARFIRQFPVWLHHQGNVLLNAWKTQFVVEKAEREQVPPDFAHISDIPLHLYHVRKSRLLLEDTSLESQGVDDGDVFILITGNENISNLIQFIRDTQSFPSNLPGTGLQNQKIITTADLEKMKAPEKRSRKKQEKTIILFVGADPSDATRLRLGEEAREIQEKLQLAKMREHFKLEQRWSVRPEDLSQALLDVKPQIVHFSGHGSSSGQIFLEDSSGKIHPVAPDVLAALFELVSGHVRCVMLNACYSEKQAEKICRHIPYVIGMNQAIEDKAAIAFSVGFYQALGGGRSIDDAFKFGCVQIRLSGTPEHLIPVLLKKEQADK